jgi:hypothetical protein
MDIRELVEEVEERTFTNADAEVLYINIPGPTFDGLTFTNLLAQLQAWLVDNGHEEDAEELEEALEAYRDASEEFHSAVAAVLEKHGFNF